MPNTAISNMASALGGTAKEEAPISEKDVKSLHAKIGQLVVERDFVRSLQSHPRNWRQKAVKQDHPDLSVRRQCRLLSLARSNIYYHPRGESAENLTFMEIIERQFLETPWYGSRPPLRTLPCNALPASGSPATCSAKGTRAGATGRGG